MANDDWIAARGGMLPLQYPFGAYRKNYYRLTTGAAAANVFIGQPMDLDSNGRATFYTIASNNLSIGPVVGFADTNLAALPSDMHSLTVGAYLPGNVDAYVLVADDPDQLFVMQEDTGGTALVAGDAGNMCPLIYRSSSGSTTTGYSTAEIDRSGVATTTGGLVMLLKTLDGPVNSDGTLNGPGNYGKWVVSILHHRFGSTSYGTPV